MTCFYLPILLEFKCDDLHSRVAFEKVDQARGSPEPLSSLQILATLEKIFFGFIGESE